MSSTITEPVAARVGISDAAILREVAEREGTTVSDVVRRLVREAAPRLTA